jgi:hypothetical protein
MGSSYWGHLHANAVSPYRLPIAGAIHYVSLLFVYMEDSSTAREVIGVSIRLPTCELLLAFLSTVFSRVFVNVDEAIEK